MAPGKPRPKAGIVPELAPVEVPLQDDDPLHQCGFFLDELMVTSATAEVRTYTVNHSQFGTLIDFSYDLMCSSQPLVPVMVSRSMWWYYCSFALWRRYAVVSDATRPNPQLADLARFATANRLRLPSWLAEYLCGLGTVEDGSGKPVDLELGPGLLTTTNIDGVRGLPVDGPEGLKLSLRFPTPHILVQRLREDLRFSRESDASQESHDWTRRMQNYWGSDYIPNTFEHFLGYAPAEKLQGQLAEELESWGFASSGRMTCSHIGTFPFFPDLLGRVQEMLVRLFGDSLREETTSVCGSSCVTNLVALESDQVRLRNSRSLAAGAGVVCGRYQMSANIHAYCQLFRYRIGVPPQWTRIGWTPVTYTSGKKEGEAVAVQTPLEYDGYAPSRCPPSWNHPIYQGCSYRGEDLALAWLKGKL